MGSSSTGRSPTGSDWLRLFRRTGFVVDDYVGLQAPADATDWYATPGQWAHRFPAEHAWKLTRV